MPQLRGEGMNPLIEWLGSGGHPVDRAEAERRAAICTTCPLNVAPLWWEQMLKDPIAEAMRITLEIKNKMNLTVDNEDSLHVCRACGCCTRLKVWSPLAIIKEHTPKSVNFPPHCWINQNTP
jgi:hypothetical protein